MSKANQIFLLSLFIIFIGYLLKRLNIIREGDGKALSRIVLNFTFPALIISKVQKMNIEAHLLYLPACCLLFCLFQMTLAYFLFRNKRKEEKGLHLIAMGGFNIGLFAFPIIEGIWGERGLQYLALFDMGNAVIILGVGYFVADYFSPLRNKETQVSWQYLTGLFLKSLPFLAYFLSVLLNILSVQFPSLLIDLADTVGRANMPLVLLLLGVYFNLRISRQDIISISKIISIRYALGLSAGLCLYFFLPFDSLYRTIALIGLILPIGLTIIPFSDKFGYNTRLAASLANLSLLISFALMWIIILLINSFQPQNQL